MKDTIPVVAAASIIALSACAGCLNGGDGGGGVPSTNADTIIMNKNTTAWMAVLDNDVDDGKLDPSTVTLLSQPTNGSATVNATTGVIEYVPDTNYVGYDNFSYSVDDESGVTSNETMITVFVKDTNANPYAVIETTKGTIVVELYTEKMPETTDNFIKLANDGFYDGLVFHRVIDGFMIQGGGFWYNGTQKQSPYGPIDLETHPDVTHIDGAISMARRQQPDTASAQFFICDGPQHFLDGQYAAFGKVIDGMDVVRAIASAEHDGSLEPNPGGGKPVEDIVIENIAIG